MCYQYLDKSPACLYGNTNIKYVLLVIVKTFPKIMVFFMVGCLFNF